MTRGLDPIQKSFLEELKSVTTTDALDALRIAYLGRKGALTSVLRSLKDLPMEKRRAAGEKANLLRQKIERGLEETGEALKKTTEEPLLRKEWIDITRPGEKQKRGHIHPITKLLREVTAIFSSLGFETVEGPEVETEYYNFDALNVPPNHPARDMWDTLWLKPQNQKLLLRTHTSPVQIRYMEKHNPPIRIIVPGRCYRYEATDASHDIQFWQLEGLMVEPARANSNGADNNISIANFKAVIQEFFSKLFRTRVTIRLRPSYFPFTEPSFEVDISCITCSAKGCSVCRRSGWLELAGAGMVHPKVFEAAGYNPKNAQGFAFGMGLDRLAMMKYKIPDIRLFHSGDLRFLKQF